MSPPSRAAWIEILCLYKIADSVHGRRLHGRRGLKSLFSGTVRIELRSPPSRAAWIEICLKIDTLSRWLVAAFTGGVD